MTQQTGGHHDEHRQDYTDKSVPARFHQYQRDKTVAT